MERQLAGLRAESSHSHKPTPGTGLYARVGGWVGRFCWSFLAFTPKVNLTQAPTPAPAAAPGCPYAPYGGPPRPAPFSPLPPAPPRRPTSRRPGGPGNPSLPSVAPPAVFWRSRGEAAGAAGIWGNPAAGFHYPRG